MFKKLLFLVLLFFAGELYAQPENSALDTVPIYQGYFGYGANMGAYPPWRDENLANIAKGNPELNLDGLGVTTFRPELPELFVDYWGYDIRVEAFQHYEDLGMVDNVLFIGQPAPHHRDTTFHCIGGRSKLFKNMYMPIWDDGMDGTPIYDSNYFARYVYFLVQHYGDYVKFWEVWNEPDLDIGGNAALLPGQPGNWWENDPPACEVQIIAPVYHYNRLLRIAYEVIKKYQPDDYIAVGGLGNPSYLDAVLRNTDNPNEGEVSDDYPLKGGAYFDCMSFHSYPHLDGSLRYWSDDIQDFVAVRHSDRAVDGLLDRRDQMEQVLYNHGFDGNQFPEKEWILTETNIPRIAYTPGFIGDSHSQRNFVLKSLIECQKYDIRQFHIFSLADIETVDSADYEFEVMGLVENLTGTVPHAYTPNEVGIAYKTISDALYEWRYDPVQTEAMNIPDHLRGAAFVKGEKEYKYVLWVRTQTDNSEEIYSTYDFPPSMNIEKLVKRTWNYSASVFEEIIVPYQVELSADPIFFTPILFTDSKSIRSDYNISIFPNPVKDYLTLEITLPKTGLLDISILDQTGRIVDQINYAALSTGRHSMKIERKNKTGFFILKIQNGDFNYIEKVVFVRE